MKKMMVTMALLLASGAALLLPGTAAARDRDDYGRYGDRDGYTQTWREGRRTVEVRRHRDRDSHYDRDARGYYHSDGDRR